MAAQLNHKLELLVWRGMIATAFGLTVLWSGASLTTLVTLFGVYALADGLLALVVRRYRGWDSAHRRRLLLRGGVGIVIAGIGGLRPSVPTMLLLIGPWAILIGALDVVAALALRKVSQRSRQTSWDAVIRRQRQMAWDGAGDRAMRYASAEKVAWDNKGDRVRRAERLGGGFRAELVDHAAKSTSSRQWQRYS
jgi:hypothetical protein